MAPLVRRLLVAVFFLLLQGPSYLQISFADNADAAPADPAANPINPFAHAFFLNQDQRLQNQTYLLNGFAFIETPDRSRNTRYSIVTDFARSMVKTQHVPNLQTVQDIKTWLKESVEFSEFEGAEVRKLNLPLDEKNEKMLYWVGHKSFDSLESAHEEILRAKQAAEAQGLDFRTVIREAQEAFQVPEEEAAVEIAANLNQQKEEALMLNMLDKIDFGEKMFGALQGQTAGEPTIWRSFGETSWRMTNLEEKNYNAQVGFWTNQVVFEGIRAPLNTINPYLEITNSLDSTGVDFKSNMILMAGLEWRPLQRNPFLTNFRPWGLPLLEWVKNYRLYFAYANREGLKDEIRNTHNHDLRFGVQGYYEFGIGLPAIDEGPANNTAEILRDYVWGEYFGDYKYSMTGLTAEENYNAITATTKLLIGLKTPKLPIPKNALMEDVVLMPYMGFEHTINDEFAYPYDNRYMLSAGVRWMPFRNYRFKENEWLSKLKIFGEYVGIDRTKETKNQSDNPGYDLRFGVNFSSNRY